MTKLKLKLKHYDPSKYLNSKEDITSFIKDSIETNNPKIIANALLVASKAKVNHSP